MMKAGAIGRLDDVTKLLQTQRRDSQWSMQHFVNRGAFPPFFDEPAKSEIMGYHPGKFSKLFASQSPSKNCRRRRSRKKCDASTSQSSDFGVSRKRFKPSTPAGV